MRAENETTLLFVTMMTLPLTNACTTLSQQVSNIKTIQASSIKNDDDAKTVADNFAKKVRACEDSDFKTCAYGLPYQSISKDDGQSLANGICTNPTTYRHSFPGCKWECANPESTLKQGDCIKNYGKIAKVDFSKVSSTFPATKEWNGQNLNESLYIVVKVLESSNSWTSGLDENSRMLALSGSLQTINIRNQDGVSDHLIIYEDKFIGILRFQATNGVDPQYYLAKAQEKYGKATKTEVADIGKFYGWSSASGPSRFMTTAAKENTLVSLVLDLKGAKDLQLLTLKKAKEREANKDATQQQEQKNVLDSVHI